VIFILVVVATFPDSPISITLVAIIGVTDLVIQPLLGIPSAQLQAQRKIVASQLVYLTPLAIRFLVILGIFVTPVADPLSGFVISSLIAGVIGLTVATLILPNAWPAFRHWRFATVPELRRATGFAILNATAVGPGEIDKSLAARLLPLATAGVYSGAARIIGAVSLPVTAMVQAALPSLFKEARQTAGIRPQMLTAMFAAAFFYGCGAAVLIWFCVPAIVWLFGEAYVGIGQAASLLCAAIPGMTLRQTSGAVLMARDQPWARILFEVSGIAVLLVAAIMLVPEFGIVGMIGAYVAAEWAMAFVAAAIVIKKRAPNK
jgi:O-antigen/teichoic acid export membrane protein